MEKKNIQAIWIGCLVDTAGTFMFNHIVALIFGKDWNPTTFFLVSGLSFVILGGYITGKLSKTNKIANATLVGIIGMVLGLDSLRDLPLWYAQIGFFSMPITAFFGGLLSTKI